MKYIVSILFFVFISIGSVAGQNINELSIDSLNQLKDEAIVKEDYLRADKLKTAIRLKKEMAIAIEYEDFKKADALKKEFIRLNLFGKAKEDRKDSKAVGEVFKNGIFADLMPGVGFYGSAGSSGGNYGILMGTSLRVGNKWLYGRSDIYRYGILFTWLRGGFFVDGFEGSGYTEIYGTAALANIGMTHMFKISDVSTVEINLSTGYNAMLSEEFGGNRKLRSGFIINPEVKLKYKKAVFGIDFAEMVTFYDRGRGLGIFHLLSASFGMKF